jgi:hypothetical protein
MSSKELPLSQPPAVSNTAPASHGFARLGRITTITDDGALTIVYEDNKPISARLATTATRQRIETAILLQQPVVIVCEQGDPLRPIIVGFMGTVEQDVPIDSTTEHQHVVEADVDGKRVRIVRKDEIILQCGQASITLRRNGRVVIRGTHVETESEGTNRIKGGQVRIN